MNGPHLLYLYCVIERGTAAHRLLEQGRVPSPEPGEPLLPIQVGGLVAVVSRVPASMFAEEPLNAKLADLAHAAPLALRHYETIRGLQPLAPALVPTALGAVFRAEKGVVGLLRKRDAHFHDLLDRVRGKQEWGLKVFRDAPRFLKATEARAQELRALRAKAAAKGPGQAYLLRKQQERALVREAERLTAQTLDALLERLAKLSAALHVDELPDVQQGSPALVLKVAALVDKEQVQRFQEEIARLGESYRALGLTLELDGPWAPYSFVGEQRVAA